MKKTGYPFPKSFPLDELGGLASYSFNSAGLYKKQKLIGIPKIDKVSSAFVGMESWVTLNGYKSSVRTIFEAQGLRAESENAPHKRPPEREPRRYPTAKLLGGPVYAVFNILHEHRGQLSLR